MIQLPGCGQHQSRLLRRGGDWLLPAKDFERGLHQNVMFDQEVSSDSSLYGNVFYTPRSVGIAELPYAHPITGASIYYRSSNGIQHPLWTVNNTQDAQATHRLYGGTSVQYDISDNLNVQYRYGYDVYSEDNTSYQNKGGVSGSVESQSGFYEKWNNTATIFNHQITINGDYELDSDWSMT